MRLLLDLGNSRLKWACRRSQDWRHDAIAYREHDLDTLLTQVWAELPAPTTVLMVSVGAPQVRDAIDRWINQRWQLPVQHVTPQPKYLGVTNTYRDPAALGADRWAALIGARGEVPDAGACVIDCGTAVTIDALSAQGEFAGGVIFPGLALLRQALAQGTAAVAASDGDDTSCLARSTADAVAAGTLYGLAGAIERVSREFEQSLGESLKLIITGGDADHVAGHLSRPARRVPDLVLTGLDRLAAAL
jgi:type III pantothenate kinase